MAKRTPLSTIKKYRWQELGLFIIPFIILLIAMTQLLLARSVRAGLVPTSSLSTKNLPTIEGLIPVLGIITIFFCINFLLSFTFPRADQILLPLVCLLSGIGVLMALRIGPNLVPASPSLGTRQLIWVVVGLVTFLITLFALRRIEWPIRPVEAQGRSPVMHHKGDPFTYAKRFEQRIQVAAILDEGIGAGAAIGQLLRIAHADEIRCNAAAKRLDMMNNIALDVGEGEIAMHDYLLIKRDL